MNDTFGPTGSGSLRSANLQSYLASKLMRRFDGDGWTLFRLTWKDKVTPSGRPYCLLRASKPRMQDTDYSSWPTPCQQDGPNGGPSQGIDRLPGSAALASWPTPCANQANGEPEAFLERKRRSVARGNSMGISLTAITGDRSFAGISSTSELANTERHAAQSGRPSIQSTESARTEKTGPHAEFRRCGVSSKLGNADNTRSQGRIQHGNGTRECAPWAPSMVEWIPCTDGKWRPVESGTFPLAHGIPGRVGRLRAYGNAIVPQVAAEFIKTCSSSYSH